MQKDISKSAGKLCDYQPEVKSTSEEIANLSIVITIIRDLISNDLVFAKGGNLSILKVPTIDDMINIKMDRELIESIQSTSKPEIIRKECVTHRCHSELSKLGIARA